jgi:thiamine biosynthesis lipoprotein
MKKQRLLVIVVAIFFVTTGYNVKREHIISGKTMGTTYRIKVVTGFFGSISGLKEKIDDRLRAIDKSMSIYIKDSEISRFNASRSVGEPFYVSEDIWRVITVGKTLYHLTQGAWDGTVNPLVNLWGFGVEEKKKPLPAKQKIDNLLTEIGFDKIEVSEKPYLVKRKASVSLDFGSIAKGYAVDEVAHLIHQNGIEQYLVEIGGEISASGYRQDGKPWRVGINVPRIDAPLNRVYRVVELHEGALATSGNYRNYFINNGIRYSHILDPRTGYPVENNVVSASVVAETCVFADGLATALMVLGPEKGIPLVNRLDSVECLIICEEKDGTLRDYASRGFLSLSKKK